MSKRFISTDLFHEDWFLDLDNEIKLFWIYAFTNCDHAGFFKVNLRAFNALNSTALEADVIVEALNAETQRIQKLTERLWFLTDFIEFQYGQNLNPNNRAHLSVIKLLEKHGLDHASCKELRRSLIGLKDKEKDKDKDLDDFNEKGVSNFNSFQAPDLEEVKREFISAFNRNGLPLDALGGAETIAEAFFNHYESQGWIRNNQMKIYKFRPLVSTWIAREKSKSAGSSNSKNDYSWNL